MDWTQVESEALRDFQALLRCPTVNPPGDEGPAAEIVLARLREVGLQPVVLESDGRPNVVVRLSGDGSLGGPLLLTGHLDVVPVEAERWTYPPFAAHIEGNYLFGRGAIDMKNMVAMCLTVVCQLASNKVPLGRDVIFAAVADEEAGCQHGSRFLVEHHPDQVRAECMVGEFGAFSLDVRGRRFYPIQVAERGRCPLELVARGEPGHGSVPHKKNAVVRLSQAIAKLGSTRLPQHSVATVTQFIREMAQAQGMPASLVLPRLLNPRLSGFVLDRLLDASVAPTFAANLSNTVCPTLLQAGEKINVIPGEARAQLDGRLLPGQRPEDLVAEVAAVVGPDIEIRVLADHPGRENPLPAHPLLETLKACVKAHDDTGLPLAFMLPGFTDAGYFGRIVPHCFGFSPVRYPTEDRVAVTKLAHAHDERIHVPGFHWGLRVLYDAVERHCRKPGAVEAQA